MWLWNIYVCLSVCLLYLVCLLYIVCLSVCLSVRTSISQDISAQWIAVDELKTLLLHLVSWCRMLMCSLPCIVAKNDFRSRKFYFLQLMHGMSFLNRRHGGIVKTPCCSVRLTKCRLELSFRSTSDASWSSTTKVRGFAGRGMPMSVTNN